MDALLRASDWDEHWIPPMTAPKNRNILLLLRTAANALQEHTDFEEIPWTLKLFTLAEPIPTELFTPAHRIVATTLLLNFSCLALVAPPEQTLQSLLFRLTVGVIKTAQPSDAEAVYRALIALGNMIYATKQFNTPFQTDELAQAKLTLEIVRRMPFAQKPGQSAAESAAEKKKVAVVTKEISAMF